MKELREDTFSGNKNDDAREHVERILDIVNLFNIPGFTHDAVMLRVFLITLTRAAKRWVDRLPPGMINTWDLLKKAFIQRYNDLLYKFPPHYLNRYQKVNIFYKGLDTMARQLLDLQGPIPNKTPAQALVAIQTIDDHSQKRHDESTSKKVSNGYETYRGSHLDKECPLREEVKSIKEVKYGEFGRSFLNNNRNEARYRLAKDCQAKAAYEVPSSSIGQCKAIYANDEAPRDETSSNGTNELHKKTYMLVEMADMTKSAPIGIVENILVKIDKFLFPSDFMIIDMLGDPNETMILGRPFLATIHARIDVFNKEISLGVGEDRIIFDMNGNVHHPTVFNKKVCMVHEV
ncbi:RNA-directed DNA polymerase, eukaryota, reverse transcriptase zinc-binding domain protein [Tanacetum coccineum]